MKYLKITLLMLVGVMSMVMHGQTRSVTLTINVTAEGGENLSGQELTLTQTDYSADYSGLKLDGSGVCQVKVYPGNHRLNIERNGYQTLTRDFQVTETPLSQSISVKLQEKTRQPYSLTTTLKHDAMTGRDDVALTWNTEAPVFYDDFESYDAFAIEFGSWTGIDVDEEVTAALSGTYPNRGVKQYAQIINPLTVSPPWWYDYPVLRPYGGKQYLGFIRTYSGNANDDWLISPVITPGTDNVLEFMAKAADRYKEHFNVYVTTVTDNPGVKDFKRLDKGNYESVDYTGWHKMSYELKDYAGQQIRFAIRYISDANRYGAFMLMVDDVYVGQQRDEAGRAPVRRVAKSPANPNETFDIYLDGVKVGTTDSYNYTLTDVKGGRHTIGIKARYLSSESEMTTTKVDIPTGVYSEVTFNVTADSKLSPDGQRIELLNTTTSELLTLTVNDGKAVVKSLPYGNYEASVAAGAYNSWRESMMVNAPVTILAVSLTDKIIDPWNITATPDDKGNINLKWNQNLGFVESFESYDDFATGTFGDWISIDNDKMPVYPIALGTMDNIVTFPGSGTATTPTAIAPMVFNPWKTTPSMLPTDPAISAPDGDKSVIFFSPQRSRADKWLITPELEIHSGYEFSIWAKAYSSTYDESLEMCISREGATPDKFQSLATVKSITAEQWSRYSVELDGYEGEKVRLAVHYTSFDAFLAQVDMVSVGPADGQSETVDYGNVMYYEIYVDGKLDGTSATPSYVLSGLSAGRHVVGVKSVYKNDVSSTTEYTIDVAGVSDIIEDVDNSEGVLYDLSGRPVNPANACQGIYIQVKNGVTSKIYKK